MKATVTVEKLVGWLYENIENGSNSVLVYRSSSNRVKKYSGGIDCNRLCEIISIAYEDGDTVLSSLDCYESVYPELLEGDNFDFVYFQISIEEEGYYIQIRLPLSVLD